MSETACNKPLPGYWRMRPRAPQPGTVLCKVDDIPDPGTREFTFGKGKSQFSMFVVRKEGRFFGYLNICPHYSSPLNFRSGEFLNEEMTRIQCTMHFAEFRIDDGFGVSGAAENCWLDSINVHVEGDRLLISECAVPTV